KVMAAPDYAWVQANRSGMFSLAVARGDNGFERVVIFQLSAIEQVERGEREVLRVATAYNQTRETTINRLTAALHHAGDTAIKWPKSPESGRVLLHLMEQVTDHNRGTSWDNLMAALKDSQRKLQPEPAPERPLGRLAQVAREMRGGGLVRRGAADAKLAALD